MKCTYLDDKNLSISKQNRAGTLSGDWTPPLCDVLPFEINNENYFY